MSNIKNVLIVLMVMFLSGCASVQEIINEKKNGVLFIINNFDDKTSVGTGYLIGENEIVTNYHVVADAKKLEALMENSTEFYELELVYKDKNIDIALLKFKDWETFKHDNRYEILEFADSSKIETIDDVYAIGNPWGFTWSITKGIIVNKIRRFEEIPQFTIQTDADIFGGNSGGPLLNVNGDVIGMNTLMVANNGGSFGFAIHANIVKKVINDFKKYNQVRWIVFGIELNPDGTVESISENSAAAESTLKLQDKIVGIELNHKTINIHNPTELNFALASSDYDQEISLRVLRYGALYRIHIKPKFKLSTEFPEPERKS